MAVQSNFETALLIERYIIDADMQNYFGSINLQCLRELLDRRIKDGLIRKMIDKWLKAGVLDNGQLVYPTEGTPQGGTISPLINNPSNPLCYPKNHIRLHRMVCVL